MKKVDIKAMKSKFQASETVKTIATIIAVLLIPAAMFAWNYFENQKGTVEGKTSSQSTVATDEAKTEVAKAEEAKKEEVKVAEENTVKAEESKTVSEMLGGEKPAPKAEPEKAKLVVDEVKELPFTSGEED